VFRETVPDRGLGPVLTLGGIAAGVQALVQDPFAGLGALHLAGRRLTVLGGAKLEGLAGLQLALVRRSARLHTVPVELVSHCAAALRADRRVALLLDAVPHGFLCAVLAFGRFATGLETLAQHVLPGHRATVGAGGRLAVLGDAVDRRLLGAVGAAQRILAGCDAVTVDLATHVEATLPAVRRLAALGNARGRHFAGPVPADLGLAAGLDALTVHGVTRGGALLLAARRFGAVRTATLNATVERLASVVATRVGRVSRIEATLDRLAGLGPAPGQALGRTITVTEAALQQPTRLAAAGLLVATCIAATLECLPGAVVAPGPTGVAFVVTLLETALEGLTGQLFAVGLVLAQGQTLLEHLARLTGTAPRAGRDPVVHGVGGALQRLADSRCRAHAQFGRVGGECKGQTQADADQQRGLSHLLLLGTRNQLIRKENIPPVGAAPAQIAARMLAARADGLR